LMVSSIVWSTRILEKALLLPSWTENIWPCMNWPCTSMSQWQSGAFKCIVIGKTGT
jgi:hypothetical protein